MTTKTVADLVTEARARVENLSVEQFEKEIEAGATVVDLREPGELEAGGRVPGAVHIPRGMIEFRGDPTSTYHDPALDPSRRTLLYCATGGRSALAAEALRALGYDDVAHLEGGFKSWVEAERPVDAG